MGRGGEGTGTILLATSGSLYFKNPIYHLCLRGTTQHKSDKKDGQVGRERVRVSER